MGNITPSVHVQDRIYRIRGQQVMLDSDLAELYGVPTKGFNRAVKRNTYRFPDDFMYQLTHGETTLLRYQFGTSKTVFGRGGRRYLPYVFTEEGVAMLSSILRSKRAALVNIAIMRAFVKLRHALLAHQGISRRIEKLEGKVDMHETDIRLMVEDLRKLRSLPEKSGTKVQGFSKE
jgi:hypothetical protein